MSPACDVEVFVLKLPVDRTGLLLDNFVVLKSGGPDAMDTHGAKQNLSNKLLLLYTSDTLTKRAAMHT